MEVQCFNSPTQNTWPHCEKNWSPQIKLYELLRKMIIIYVQTETGEFTKVTVTPNCKILDIKQKIKRHFGIEIKDQCLIFQGQCLQNDNSVSACDLSSCSVVEVISTKTIQVKAQDGGSIAIEVYPHEKVVSVKQKIKIQSTIPVHRQCLLLNGKQLGNDRELCACDFKNGVQLHLTLSIQIFVRNLSGMTRIFHIKPFHTIEDIIGLIESKESIPRKWISLSYAGKFLEPRRTLLDYNIQNESTINMNVRFNSSKNLIFAAGFSKTCSEEDYDDFSSSFDYNSDLHNSTMID